MIGTVDYMPPEQATDDTLVDLRADIYALGATLYLALTGQIPFPREGDVPKLMAKLNEAPPKPSEIAPRAAGGVRHRHRQIDGAQSR